MFWEFGKSPVLHASVPVCMCCNLCVCVAVCLNVWFSVYLSMHVISGFRGIWVGGGGGAGRG